MSRFLGEDGLAMGIDPQEMVSVDIPKVSAIISPAQFKFFNGYSYEYNILGAVYEILGDKKLDILFIDGDHHYEAVKKDYEMYSNLVKSPGMIILHDIGDFDTALGTTVEYWNKELRKKHPYAEIVSNPPVCGIGVIYV